MAKKEKEKCPYCGKEFTNLSRHKCKDAPKEDGAILDGTNRTEVAKQLHIAPPEGKEIESCVYVGSRPTMNYVIACLMSLNKGDDCVVKARGRAIAHAVDVCEIVKRRFIKGVEYGDIKIETEVRDGKGVSAMEIVLIPPK